MPRSFLFGRAPPTEGADGGKDVLPGVASARPPREDVRSPLLAPPRSARRPPSYNGGTATGGQSPVPSALPSARSPMPTTTPRAQGTLADTRDLRSRGRAATVHNAAAVAAAAAAIKQLNSGQAEPRREIFARQDSRGGRESSRGGEGRRVRVDPPEAPRKRHSGISGSSNDSDEDDPSSWSALRAGLVSPGPHPSGGGGSIVVSRASSTTANKRGSGSSEGITQERRTIGGPRIDAQKAPAQQTILHRRSFGAGPTEGKRGSTPCIGEADRRTPRRAAFNDMAPAETIEVRRASSQDESDLFAGLMDEIQQEEKLADNPRGRTSKDIDREMEEVLSGMASSAAARGAMRRQTRAKTMGEAEAEEKKDPIVESYTERVVRYQENKEMLDQAVEEKYGFKRGVSIDNDKLCDRDVEESVLRVRAKLQALKANKQDFLEGGAWNREARAVPLSLNDEIAPASVVADAPPVRGKARRKTMV